GGLRQCPVDELLATVGVRSTLYQRDAVRRGDRPVREMDDRHGSPALHILEGIVLQGEAPRGFAVSDVARNGTRGIAQHEVLCDPLINLPALITENGENALQLLHRRARTVGARRSDLALPFRISEFCP